MNPPEQPNLSEIKAEKEQSFSKSSKSKLCHIIRSDSYFGSESGVSSLF